MISFNAIFKHNAQRIFTPKWLKRITYFTPTTTLSWIIEQRLNTLFHAQLQTGELDFLCDQSICIEVRNIPLYLFVSLESDTHKLKVLVLKSAFKSSTMAHFDGKLSGDSDSFLELIAGHSDPDTLFFRRKLSIEGDTELCLTFKNWLDTQDPAALFPPVVYQSLQDYVTEVA